jgi:GTP cyclohydrolase IA
MKHTPLNQDLISLEDLIGNDHSVSSVQSPIRPDAFDMPEEQKIAQIAEKFKEIMLVLGLDLNDDSLRGTPGRVARMYVRELFEGMNPANKPAITLFDNKYRYKQMLVEKNILVQSVCEHHFVPILGKAHIGYISSGTVIGLSKLNRIVEYYSRRPQVQERLNEQIADELKNVLKTEDVAVIIDAEHLCVQSRGIRDTHSSTVTASYHGKFLNESTRCEFLKYVEMTR